VILNIDDDLKQADEDSIKLSKYITDRILWYYFAV
jgi:hypothetical protein